MSNNLFQKYFYLFIFFFVTTLLIFLFVNEEFYVVFFFFCLFLFFMVFIILNFIILKFQLKNKIINNNNYVRYFIVSLLLIFLLVFKLYLILDLDILKLPKFFESSLLFLIYIILLLIMGLFIYILSGKDKGLLLVYILYPKLIWSFLGIFFAILILFFYGDNVARASDDLSQVINFENSPELMVPSNFEKYDLIYLNNFDLISVTLVKNLFILKNVYSNFGVKMRIIKILLNDTEIFYDQINFYKVFYKNQAFKSGFKLCKNLKKKK